jgi:23S rRNA (guanine2445-N2)-methyltransferase / 23S rRNA (guanine2069-N7)-methyltransferase
MTIQQLHFFATTPKGLELLLVDELRSLGATKAAEKLAGVEFTGSLELAYKACLWSRLANRILLRLTQIPAHTPDELYLGVQTISWEDHIHPDSTIAVNFVSSQSNITHTLFGAQKVKDAIVDQFREKFNRRPSVARSQPNVSVNVYVHRDQAVISLDLSGDSLHKRAYRLGGGGVAPLKENLAAAILLRANWQTIAKSGGTLVDPMCGSGTLLIEGAMIACDIAPGLLRDYFGFLGWNKHVPEVWDKLVADARIRREKGLVSSPSIMGFDADAYAIKIAFENIERAGLLGKVHVEKKDLSLFEPKKNIQPGLVIVNPPYGERLGEEVELQRLYAQLGAKLKSAFCGWDAGVLTGNPELGKQMGIRAKKYYALFNGAIPCQLLLFSIVPESFVDRSPSAVNEKRIANAKRVLGDAVSEAAQMFVNRLQKNRKHIERWAHRENIFCYRLYDADLPEYAFSIDLYSQYVYVKEYLAPKTVDAEKALRRQQEVLSILPDVLDVLPSHIFFHMHQRKAGSVGTVTTNVESFYPIQEGEVKFLVNLSQLGMNTGLKLQQRALRALIQRQAQGGHFLNLFDPAGVMTICAAQGGALTTKTVVNSALDYQWVKQNLLLNNFVSKQHQVITTDTLLWFDRERTRYHLIFADLPAMEDNDVLLYQLLKLLLPDGMLLLTTQDKRFKIDPDLFPEFSIDDISQQMLPPDFARQSSIQRCWRIS